jgi:hypothetical protein
MDGSHAIVEIKGSQMKLIGLFALGILMTGASGMIAAGAIPVRAGSYAQFIGWAGLVFFGACTLVIGSRFLQASKTVVTLSPEGLLDTRVAERPIPWAEIQDIGVWTMQGQKIIVLPVPPETESVLGLTRIARWSRGANKKLGADGLCVTAHGLKISHDALLAQVVERVDAARAG